MLQANREHEVPASSRGCVATAFGCLRGCVERFLFAVPVGAAMTDEQLVAFLVDVRWNVILGIAIVVLALWLRDRKCE